MNWSEFFSYVKGAIAKGWFGGYLGVALFISMNVYLYRGEQWLSQVICGSLFLPVMFLGGCILWTICMRGSNDS